jgi:hypothetical protein
MSQICDLLWCQSVESVVSFPSRSKFVLSEIPEYAEASEAEYDDLHCEIDRMSDVVEWCIVGEIGPAGMCERLLQKRICRTTHVARMPPIVPSETT